MSVYSGNMNEISTEKVILTDKDIYRKLSNINGTYGFYVLEQLNTNFVWSKVYDNVNLNGCEILDMDRLSYTVENTILNDNENYSFLTIYKVDEKNTLTKTTTFNGSYEIPLYWKDLSPELNIRLINKYVVSKRIKDLPTHIDLTREYSDENDECPNNEYNPLQGWSDVDINEQYTVINDWCTLDKVNGETVGEEVKEETVGEDEDMYFDGPVHLEDKYEEERLDPYDSQWYTESEFINYYGGKVEWEHQVPKNILLREEYFKFANTFSHLSAKKFIFLFNKYNHQVPKNILLREEYFKFANTFSHLSAKKFIFLFNKYNQTFL